MDALRDIFRLVSPDVLLVLLGVCVAVAVAWFVWNRVRALAWLAKCRNLALALLLGAMAATGVYNGFAKLPQNHGIVALWNYGNEAMGIVGEAQFHNASLAQFHNYTISQLDISNGWRVVYTADGSALTPPFEGVATNDDWRFSGAYDDSMRINPAGWAFPWKGGTMSGITVLSWCEFMPSVMTNYFPAPFPDKVSLVPECNWHLIPSNSVPYEGDAALTTNESVFWHGITTNNSLVLTWQNATYARDANCLTNFQAELFADGSFEYRYDDSTVGYSRVHPLDLDFDGLPNAIDPEPEIPLATTAWNQSEAWAVVAFPSNAAEIASVGGYAAWVAQRASDPNRRLVGLNIALQGGRWPVCVEVCGVPVMADGNAELLYAIDCGAQVPFVLSDGELETVTLHGVSNVTEPCYASNYPYERWAGDVVVHLDSPRTGWLRRVAEVDVDDVGLVYLFPSDNVPVTAVVTNCHADAYLGCTWYGGAGISFFDEHSLETIISYTSTNFVPWATNNVSLVTEYAGGYAITNTSWFTVGQNIEPSTEFSIDCQSVFFLNDADIFDASEYPTNRPERIRPVTLNLRAPYGTGGTVTVSAEGEAAPIVCHVVDGATNIVTATTPLTLTVTDPFARTGTYTVYVSCPRRGTGTLSVTLTLDGGATLSDTAIFKCIEPLRKLVTTGKVAGRFINPSRLVVGTNAVLKVGVNGDFDPSEIKWRVVSGPGVVSPTNGLSTTVSPTGTVGTVVVEARFNDDEIQPTFVLPVVMPRTIPLRAFVAVNREGEPAITKEKLNEMIKAANVIFSQAGLFFQLQGDPMTCGGPDDWNLTMYNIVELYIGDDDLSYDEYTPQFMRLVKPNLPCDGDGIDMFFVGTLKFAEGKGAEHFALCTSGKIVIPQGFGDQTLAHELGHTFGLKDIYLDTRYRIEGEATNWNTLSKAKTPVDGGCFGSHPRDWGEETGRGFYDKSDTLGIVIKRLLMYGMAEFGEKSEDMPDDTVFGIASYGAEELVKVGAEKIDKEKGTGNE